jgi:mannan endo-1,4-beta-mannosidase
MASCRLCSFSIALLCVAVLAGCGSARETVRGDASEIPSAAALGLADGQATPETRALYANLRQLTGEHVLFGHHDALAYGKNWDDSTSTRQLGRSDVKGVTGSHPALVGFDVLSYKEGVDSVNTAARAAMRERILHTYEYGGVAALTWHAFNPVSGGDSWDTTRAVGAILPGGERHARYRAMLDDVARFFHSLRTADGTPVPVIFRPFHEMNGDWFWWGKGHAPPAQFVELWQFTVRYLRDEKNVHHALWAYCPDIFDTRGGYLTRYPGDAYVDMLGFDDYYDFYGEERDPEMFTEQLKVLGQLAKERGKLAAVTETGLEGIPDSTWWTDTMLEALKTGSLTRRVVYVMAWRNAHDRPDHFYAPYPGHASAPDFRQFAADPFIWLAEDLPPLYRGP